jgi:aquaporin Z
LKPPSADGEGDQPDWREPERFLAEAIATFALTFVAAGTVMAGALSHGQVDHTAKAIAPGLIVLALIYAFGDVSGALQSHSDRCLRAPGRLQVGANTRILARATRRAAGAALLLRSTLGGVAHLGATQTTRSDSRTIILEAVLTALLVTVILNGASRHSLIGTDAAIGSETSGSMSRARCSERRWPSRSRSRSIRATTRRNASPRKANPTDNALDTQNP